MNLTEKCKEDFEKWYFNENYNLSATHNAGYHPDSYINFFYKLPKPMQYGVYVDFFDSVGIYIQVSFYDFDCNNWQIFIECKNGINDYVETHFTSRPEARLKAIEKANEIYNK